ncbi:MAG TPA: hypothetical protein VF067_02055 [Sphingomicrobium sp.]
MKSFVIALSALSLLAGSAANAAVCRDAKGHFIKCPKHAVAKAKKCRDAKGHFAKCGTKGAKPA